MWHGVVRVMFLLFRQSRAHDAQEAHKKHVQKFIDRFRYNANRAAQVLCIEAL